MAKPKLPLELPDTSGLTDADWTEINKLKLAYDKGGQKALSKAIEELAADEIRYMRVGQRVRARRFLNLPVPRSARPPRSGPIRNSRPWSGAVNLRPEPTETALRGCPSWIHIEPCVAPRGQPLGRFWKIFGACNLLPERRAAGEDRSAR
jgi:hypothetical protein